MFFSIINHILLAIKTFTFTHGSLLLNKKVLFIPVVLFCLYQNQYASEHLAKKGILDVHSWNFSKDGVIDLNGEWEFYPWKYYSPVQLSSLEHSSPIYVHVPGKWTKYSIHNSNMPPFGFATFRIKIIVDSTYKSGKKLFALKMPQVFSTFKIWVDTSFLFEQGKPGRNFYEHIPKIAPVIIPFVISHDTVIVTLQVTNYFSSVYAGINSSILFGLNDDVIVQSRRKEFWYISGTIFCFTLGVYFFLLFLLRQERKINLLFTLTCFILGVRYLIDNENIITLFSPNINVTFEFKVLVLCLNFGPVVLWTAYLFFPQEINQKLLKYNCILFLFYSLFIIFVPVWAYGQVVNIIFIHEIFIIIYIIIAAGIAYHRKRESAAIYFYGMIITPAIFANNMFSGKYYIPVGALLFLILQAFAITSKFVNSHKRVIQLSGDLQLMNENLEMLVTERTKEVNAANDSLMKLNFAKDRFISILSHDLRSPLNSLIGLSRRLFINAEKNDPEKVICYSKMINESAETCHTLAENLLDWSLIQSGINGVLPKKIILKDVIENVYSLLRNASALKNIRLINSVDSECEVFADERMTESIIRNIVINGIKYTPHSGKVEVSAERSLSFYEIKISDTGIGMAKEDVQNLFRIDKKVYNLGTADEPGSGFGLILTKEFITCNGGSISVKSELGKGTVVSFTLPGCNEYM